VGAVGGPEDKQVVAARPEEQVGGGGGLQSGQHGRDGRVVALVPDPGGDLEVAALDEAVFLEELGEVAAGSGREGETEK